MTTTSAILPRALACTNCDEYTPRLEAWCMECFAGEKATDPERVTPVALCKQCNIGLHTPAKLSLHRRQPFRCNTDRMRTADELGLATLPADLPPLCSLMCSNCEVLLDDPHEPQWCAECALILCKECSKELHAPVKKRAHQRFPFAFRFIAAAHLADENGTILEADAANNAAGRTPSSATASFASATPVNLAANATASAASSSSNRASMPRLPLATSSVASSLLKKSAVGLMKTASLVQFLANKKKAGERDDSKTNAGVPGDVLQMVGEPALTGPFECTLHEFKNTFNDFDTIGAVQIVQICCGLKHVGCVTQGGSLFMFGSNHSNQLGVDTGDEKEIREPQIVQIPGNRPVRMIGCGSEHSVCITMDNKAFSWGSGLLGILGHQSDINRETPTEIDLHWNPSQPADPQEKLVYVACGPHNSGIVVQGRADRRQLYTFGAGEYGQLGTGQKTPSLQPQLIHVEADLQVTPSERYPPVDKLAFGTNHTVAVTTNGACYTFGSNSFGQLGYLLDGQEGASTPTSKIRGASAAAQSADLQLRPRLVEALAKRGLHITHAACGELSTSVLTSSGEVWSFGSGETHQLGIMDNVDCFAPVKAAVLSGDKAETKAVALAVGVSSCAAITESGDCYMWGWSVEKPIPTIVQHLRSNHLQSIAIGAHDNVVCLTGVAHEIHEWRFTEEGEHAAQQAPQQNRALRGKRLVSISVGKGRCAAATAAGVLLEWGVDTRDPNAPEDVEFDPYRPRELRCAWQIAEVKCALEHTVALTTDGQCLTWGGGGLALGCLGHGSDRECTTPTVVEALKGHVCTSIGIGPGNTGVTTSELKVFVWGGGSSGQLGNNDVKPIFLPTQIAAMQHVEVVALAFGNRHCVLLSKDGSVYTTGDNSFGQCGLGSSAEAKYLVPQEVKFLSSTPMAYVACGDNVTLLLSRSGRVYGFGAGETNQLPGQTEDVHTPIEIAMPFASHDASAAGAMKSPTRITELSVATINCAALADNGAVYCWGFALGESVTRIDAMVKEGFVVEKIAMGPSSILMQV